MTDRTELIWVADGIQPAGNGALTSTLASNRYRVLLPMEGLRAQGLPVRLLGFGDWLDTPLESLASCRCLVVGKLLPAASNPLPQALYDAVINRVLELQSQGIKVLADFCDDHFDRELDGRYWRALARTVDVCVAGSDAMAARITSVTDRPVVVVGDPVASPWSRARVFKGAKSGIGLGRWHPFGTQAPRRLQLVWYGHPSNWAAFKGWAEKLASAQGLPPLMFWVVSSPLPAMLSHVDQFNLLHASTSRMELVPWSEQGQWDVLAGAEVVLLPAGLDDPRKSVKTANRLIDGLHAGCYVVASPVPSYLAYADHVSLTDDPVTAIRAYLGNPDQFLQKAQQGQAVVKALASSEAIARQWVTAFAQAGMTNKINPATAAITEQTADTLNVAEPVRLNIGCGDKILPGYVNVDVVQSRAGKKPDVIADVRDLKVFETGYADEVMAIHVVEHFWRWEVEDVVREWIRVLKPGGMLVLECPNLLSACEALLADPSLAARSDQAGQRSMWVFYGDPQWKDPLMIHRWGYTPQSLKELLVALGLVDVRQEPAQFKLREPRDMRIVGRKAI
jgi:hypothetical protein